jgi:hypothetical protein
MNNLTIATLCAALALPALGCQSRVASRQDKETHEAAETAVKEQHDLAKDVRKDFDKGVSDVSKDLKDVNRTEAEFTAKRDARIAALRGIHALDITQLSVLRGYMSAVAYTAAAEAAINSKLADVETALDESGKLIEALPSATADEWAARDDEVAAAMTHLVVTLKDAQVTMRDAPREAPTPAS